MGEEAVGGRLSGAAHEKEEAGLLGCRHAA
jgi:hypothetical protein